MASYKPHDQRPIGLVRIASAVLNSDLVDLVSSVWQLGRRIVTSKVHEGLYEVLAFESRLELLDIQGKKAVLTKREKVRFLQDNIIAYQDQAWGDGEIFADYKCSPGVAVDRYREGHRYRVLISLRQAKSRGDIQEFHIVRTIKNGFTKHTEDFQTEVDHTTHSLSMSVVFPRRRPPKQAELIEQNATRTTPLGPQYRLTLPDGRQQIRWHTKKPELFEAYILRWEW